MPDFGRPIFHAAGTLLLQERAAAALKFPCSAYIYAIMGLLVSVVGWSVAFLSTNRMCLVKGIERFEPGCSTKLA